MRDMTLVTTGAGFLGSHLCDRLIKDGYDVICVDNFYSSAKQNIYHLLNNPHFELIRHDVTFPLYLEVSQIYNLVPRLINSVQKFGYLILAIVGTFMQPLPEVLCYR